MGVKADFNPETFYWYLYLFQWNILSADKNIVSEAPRNFVAKVLNSAQERTTV